jgi:hypothetical protein
MVFVTEFKSFQLFKKVFFPDFGCALYLSVLVFAQSDRSVRRKKKEIIDVDIFPSDPTTSYLIEITFIREQLLTVSTHLQRCTTSHEFSVRLCSLLFVVAKLYALSGNTW